MKYKLFIKQILLISSLLIVYGFTNKLFVKKKYYENFNPPGTIEIKDNFFVDKYELKNFSYREYIYWIERIYGDSSKTYKSVLPNELVWFYTNLKCIDNSYYQLYLSHPAYNYYPVVGISKEQAKNYLEWRSDRVFEALLIKHKVITWNPYQTANNYFSIKNYFEGKYNNLKPDSNYFVYPKYSLPTIEDIEILEKYNDSLRKLNPELKVSIKNSICKDTNQIGINVCNDTTFLESPTRLVHLDWINSKEDIYNLKGNVSEWINEEETYYGGNWFEKDEIKFKSIKKLQTAYIGFRGVCKWVKWE